jgi:beta-glucanase (GH16 family)
MGLMVASSTEAGTTRPTGRQAAEAPPPATASEPVVSPNLKDRKAAPAPRPPVEPECGGERPKKSTGGKYTCTFTDDFDGGTLDTNKWTAVKTSDNGFTTGWAHSPDCYVTGPENVSVSDGVLRLTSRFEAEPFVCETPYGPFTSTEKAGSVTSWGKFAQTYGRFEFRAKFQANASPDFDSALWMYPQNPAYGAWPNSGEIDVAEWFGSNYTNQVFPSVHYAGEVSTLSTGRSCIVPTAGTEFHSYAVEWTSSMMSFYYDGQLCHQHAWTPNAPLTGSQPFDQPFNLVMTQSGGYNRPAGTTVSMEIDWVRAWK